MGTSAILKRANINTQWTCMYFPQLPISLLGAYCAVFHQKATIEERGVQSKKSRLAMCRTTGQLVLSGGVTIPAYWEGYSSSTFDSF